jgi:hypothetical protein
MNLAQTTYKNVANIHVGRDSHMTESFEHNKERNFGFNKAKHTLTKWATNSF